MKTMLITRIAGLLQARQNCLTSNNIEWYEKHTDKLESLSDLLPSGSGIDSGTKIDLNDSNENKIVLCFGFHHMDENGNYNGWTDHKVIITPSLVNTFNMKITGKDINGVKDYLFDLFDTVLNTEIEY